MIIDGLMMNKYFYREVFSWAAHFIFLMIISVNASSQSTNVGPEDDYKRLISIRSDVASLGENPFGENISIYDGRLSFSQADVSLRGEGPDINVVRRFDFVDSADFLRLLDSSFSDWDLDLPRISTYAAFQYNVNGWQTNGINPNALCTQFGPPPIIAGQYGGKINPDSWMPDRWWYGYQLHVDGGSENILERVKANGLSPQGMGSFNLLTKSNWVFSCLAAAENDSSREAFLGVSPKGVKYWFNHLYYRSAPTIRRSRGTNAVEYVVRKEASMLVTRIEDRFGNAVTYSYDDQDRLMAITGSDARSVSFQYVPNKRQVASITVQGGSAGPRTYTYSYGAKSTDSGSVTVLTSVGLPDGSFWSMDMGDMVTKATYLLSGGASNCNAIATLAQVDVSGTIVHPSGLIGKFTVHPVRRGRSFVPKDCWSDVVNESAANGFATIPNAFYTTALVKREYSGAGVPSITWSYQYSPSNESWQQDCVAGQACPTTVWTDVVDPKGAATRYTFSNKYDVTEGLPISTESYASGIGSDLLKKETFGYADPSAGPYPSQIGWDLQDRINRSQAGVLTPQNMHSIAQDGDVYTWQAEAFNEFTQPTKIKRYNTISWQPSIEEETSYLNDLPHWVLGLPQQVTNVGTGEIESLNVYDTSRVTLSERWRFGQKLMSYAFYDSGLLGNFTDGNNHTTTLTDYKRGIPQTITYPDGTTQKLVVDDFGQVTSITDQLGTTTGYQYDSMGRVTWVQPPSGDEVAWHATAYDYSFVTTAERGIPANHWRRITTKGSSLVFQYYDAMMRPILTDTYISGDASSHGNLRRDYDWRGQSTFASYAVGGTPDLAAITAGTHTGYDALGREVLSQVDSEQGLLSTTTRYALGTRKIVTDPKGGVTTQAYRAFDQPAYDQLIQVQTPEGITQDITRDIYGNPTQIAQSGSYNGQGVALGRNLTYDSFHRLCRRYEPESDSEVIDYDGANNVVWRATGVPVNGDATVCGRDQVAASAKLTNSYDAMNRLTAIAAPAGTQSTIYTYDAAGRMTNSVSGSVILGYGYNKRGMLTTETQWIPTTSYSRTITTHHDAYGNVQTIAYPDGAVFGWFPDPLGRPTVVQGGSTFYAKNLSYFPDGSLQSYTLGNGITEVLQRNARQLPSNLSYGSNGALSLSEDYGYDANGNLTSVNDLVNGYNTQTLAYDGLNRLISAQAPNSWGTETYSYDPLNSMRAKVSAGLSFSFNYDGLNHLTGMTANGSNFANYGYDARGNRIHEQVVFTTHDYTIDAKNQILSVAGQADYLYDAEGRRIQKTLANGKISHSFYNQAGRLMYAYAEDTGLPTDYLYLGSRLVARWQSGAATYLLTDRLGSPVKEANAAGQVTANFSFRPYGALYEGTAQNEPGFTAHVNDPETALVYMQARYNDGSTGQFLSVDPVTPEPGDVFGFNRYAYANNNPVIYTDPDGRESACAAVNNCLNNTGSKYLSAKTGQAMYGLVAAVANEWNGVVHSGTAEGDQIAPSTGAEAIGMAAGGILINLGEAAATEGRSTELTGVNASGQLTSRSSFRSGTIKSAWENASEGPAGGRLCPTCGKEVHVPPASGVPRDWDVSHNPSWSNRSFSPGVSRQDVIDNYQKGTSLECPSCNRGGGNDDGRFK